MADNFMGLFSSPEDVRQARIAAENAAYDKAMLSGNDFMRGQAMGQRIGSSLGGMMGMQSADEIRAQQINDIVRGVGAGDMSDPENLGNIAKILNDNGYTKEAVLVMDKRQKEIDRLMKTSDVRENKQTMMVPKTYKGKPAVDDEGNIIYEPKTIYSKEKFYQDTMRWEPIRPEKSGDAATGQLHTADSLNQWFIDKYGVGIGQ